MLALLARVLVSDLEKKHFYQYQNTFSINYF